MSYTYGRTETSFIASESAPNAIEAKSGKIVPNNHGTIALRGFIADILDDTSEVKLDTSVRPPVLHLKNALTTTLFGNINKQNGELINFIQEQTSVKHIVSGAYTGPGSELDLI